MAISGISGISAYMPIQSIRPMQMPLENQSVTSDAYAESVKSAGSVGGEFTISPVNPVRYPNAIDTDDNKIDAEENNRILNKGFNKIASNFADKVTSYNQNGAGMGYAQLGTAIDIVV
ncbi:MAG: hypothetical protein K6A23_08200 [Butyrivibrio sp.]|nr:hypothetical protein [Butyrivibrio sp.]